MKALLLAASSFFFATLLAEKVPFEKYSHVVSRYPFGVPPQGFDPNVSPKDASKNPAADAETLTQEQQTLKRNVSFSVINVTADGTAMVGFSDNSNPKAPQHYYIRAGESQNGWHVKEADVKKKSIILVKDGVEIPLSLGTNSAADKTAAAGAVSPAKLSRSDSRPPLRPSSFFGRRAKREKAEAIEKERLRRAEAEAKKKEEDAAAERENNRLIREEQTRQLEELRAEFLRVREEKKKQEKENAAKNGNEENNY